MDSITKNFFYLNVLSLIDFIDWVGCTDVFTFSISNSLVLFVYLLCVGSTFWIGVLTKIFFLPIKTKKVDGCSFYAFLVRMCIPKHESKVIISLFINM